MSAYADSLKAQVQRVLKPTEVVKAILEGVVVKSGNGQRILAIVSHREDWDLSEEGCLFVFKYQSGGGVGQVRLEMDKVFPVYGRFVASIGQMRSGQGQGQGTVMTLNVNSAEGGATFMTADKDGLKALVAECRRLKEASDIDETTIVDLRTSTAYFSWLKVYLERKERHGYTMYIKRLTTTPLDLRLTTRSLIERFSRASASPFVAPGPGASTGDDDDQGDDYADIQLIQDDWVRANAHRKAGRGKKELMIRLGTFNVNGKIPSQDLSAWVQGIFKMATTTTTEDSTSALLPHVTNISPLSSGLRVYLHGDGHEKQQYEDDQFDWATMSGSAADTLTDTPNMFPPPDPSTASDTGPDMLVLAFQELDLSTEALIYYTNTAREDAWSRAVFAALGEKAEGYEKLASKQLVGMLLVIIVKKSLKGCFGDIKTASAGAGILGVMGNKGGTAIRLSFTPPTTTLDASPSLNSIPAPHKERIAPTTLTFVNSHLAAFDEMVEKRNADYKDLGRRLLFEHEWEEGSERQDGNRGREEDVGSVSVTSVNGVGVDIPISPRLAGGEGGGGDGKSWLTVFECDVLFWMGDLNYRLDLSDTQVRQILQDDEWDLEGKVLALMRFDQLKKAMRDNKAFSEFKEGVMSHMPSYRFSPGLMMDKLGYDLKRKPAWTDRILSLCSPRHHHLIQRSYTVHPEIVMSDHRPVAADYTLEIDTCDLDVFRSSVRKLFADVVDVDSVDVDGNGRGLRVEVVDGDGGSGGEIQGGGGYVDFGKLRYGKKVVRKLRVANTGKTPCAFRFVPVVVDAAVHPEWLHIHPLLGLLLPAQSTYITLTAHVCTPALAGSLNLLPKDLSGTLILHPMMIGGSKRGRNRFVGVGGEWEYTCFGNTLARLTKLRGAIRSMASPNDVLSEGNAINAPREIMRLINWMMGVVGKEEMAEMFLLPGDDAMVDEIIECLDTGSEFPSSFSPSPSPSPSPSASASHPASFLPSSPHLAFATTLLRLLVSLADAVVPSSLHAQCTEAQSRDEAFELLDALPPVNVNVWISLTAFLHFVCASVDGANSGTDEGGAVLHVDEIAAIFAPILLRDDPDPNATTLPISPTRKRRFLKYFIG